MAKTAKPGTRGTPSADDGEPAKPAAAPPIRSEPEKSSPWQDLKLNLGDLYEGRNRHATRFRYALLIFDILIVIFFLLTVPLDHPPWLIVLDAIIAVPLILDFLARFWIARSRSDYLLQVTTITDALIIVSLLLPLFFDNLAFLRVLRMLRLLRSHHVMRDLRNDLPFVRRNEELLHSLVNLSVFVFAVTALVFVLEDGINPQINNYLDALYFTVTTLTTTGFGDITLQDRNGRLLSVVIMVVGVALFLRLVQTVFRPNKVRHTCPDCGLKVHDPDAVHCKHCGRVLNIETEGHR